MTIIANMVYASGRRVAEPETLQQTFHELRTPGRMAWIALGSADADLLSEDDRYDDRHLIVVRPALELDSTMASKRLAEISVEQNEQAKKIASWAAIIFAPQLVGSVYGMNFDRMPELHWTWGYPFALGLMATVAVTLFVVFKRNEWL